MNKEQWQPVKGYEDRYEVSDQGRVKSLNYRQQGFIKIMKPRVDTGGYLQATLSKRSIIKIHFVHVLVLETFVRLRPLFYVCHHKDSNPANNWVINLEWVTYSENTLRGRLLEFVAKLTKTEVLQIREKYAKGNITQKVLGKEYGIDQSEISYIVNRKKWVHI